MPKISFSCLPEWEAFAVPPTPASHHTPQWFRALEGYPPDPPSDEFPVPTVKRCSPFKDAMYGGYLLRLSADLQVVAKDPDDVNFNWSPGLEREMIQSHGVAQYAGFPAAGIAFKFINPWIVKTPPGYSSLFVTPMNRALGPFQILSGVVDTDLYENSVNFPFFWVEYPWEGILEAGTPIAQVIPFKREPWKLKVEELRGKAQDAVMRTRSGIFARRHFYTKLVRQRKEWR